MHLCICFLAESHFLIYRGIYIYSTLGQICNAYVMQIMKFSCSIVESWSTKASSETTSAMDVECLHYAQHQQHPYKVLSIQVQDGMTRLVTLWAKRNNICFAV